MQADLEGLEPVKVLDHLVVIVNRPERKPIKVITDFGLDSVSITPNGIGVSGRTKGVINKDDYKGIEWPY